MFATKKDAENWIAEYATKTLLAPKKIGYCWKIVPFGMPLSEAEIHEIEEMHELKARQIPEENRDAYR